MTTYISPRNINTSMIVLSLKYLNNNYKVISNVSKWIFNELFTIKYSDIRLLRALDEEDFKTINILIKFIRDKSVLNDYLFKYYSKIYQIRKSKYTVKRINNLRDVIKLLIELSDNPDRILCMVCEEGDYEIAKLLIEKGLKINTENDRNLVSNASKIVNSFELVKLLVNNGARIDECALSNASLYRHYDIVKFLIENGADIHEENDISLIQMCTCNNLELVKFFIDNGANIHARNNRAIADSNRYGHFDIVKLLLDNGADHNIENDYLFEEEDKTILINAAIHNRYDIVEILIDRNNKNGYKSKYEYNMALAKACKNGYYDIVKILISHGGNVRDDLLLKTSKHGHFNIVKLLIDNGADIHTDDNYILKYACKYGYIDIVKLFLDYSISNEILLKTVKYGHYDIIKLLLDYVINIDKIVLDEAIKYNRLSILELLKAKMKIYS